MFPFRHSSIFRSRWMALLWAAGIIWFAVDTVPAAPVTNDAANADNAVITDVTGSPVSDKDMDALKRFVDGQ
jgi:hypothetical protein